jgi:anaerobic selenocysteine-containing dehydrogenase
MFHLSQVEGNAIRRLMHMQIDRELFLKALAFAGGGTAGLMTSPAPWHFIRDLARWTQNWPWVPVPPHGKPSTVSSICGMCNGECGILVRKVDERMVRVDGNPHHPVNRGFICPLGIASLQMVYGPSRIRQPLKRTASRGDGKWQAISWEEAIAEFADKIQQLRDARQSHTIACITSNSDGTTNELLGRFLRAVGSGNLAKMDSGRDARAAVLKIMQGIDGDLAYDFENADFILSFGCSFFEGWGTCGRMYGAIDSWYSDKGKRAELIQIEPNLSTTALKASQWIPNKPGAEAALALGIAHVLISDGSYDEDFVDKHCFGFKDWEDKDGKKHSGFASLLFANYSPPSVEKITGVSVKDIEGLAQRFAAANHPLAVGGGGRGQFFNGIHELMAIHALNALAGNINKSGGVLVKAPVPLAPLPEVQMDAEAVRGYSEVSAKNPFSFSTPGSLNPAEIKLLLVHEANPLYALPERQVAESLFEEVPYIVSLSSYMDESADHADLILPIPTRMERWDDRIAAPE